jgi:hypothetical protein
MVGFGTGITALDVDNGGRHCEVRVLPHSEQKCMVWRVEKGIL